MSHVLDINRVKTDLTDLWYLYASAAREGKRLWVRAGGEEYKIEVKSLDQVFRTTSLEKAIDAYNNGWWF